MTCAEAAGFVVAEWEYMFGAEDLMEAPERQAPVSLGEPRGLKELSNFQ